MHPNTRGDFGSVAAHHNLCIFLHQLFVSSLIFLAPQKTPEQEVQTTVIPNLFSRMFLVTLDSMYSTVGDVIF